MFWESGGANSWRALGVRSQPVWMLLNAGGEVLIEPKFGGPKEDEILEAIGA